MKPSRLLLSALALLLFGGNAWASPVTGMPPTLLYSDDADWTETDRWDYDDHLPSADINDPVVFETTRLFKRRSSFTELFAVETAGSYRATLVDFEFPMALKELAVHISSSTESLAKLWEPGSLILDLEPGEYYVSLFAVAGRGSRHGEAPWGDRWMPWEWHDDWRGHHGHGRLGQYGLEIALTTTVVPVPSAVWLFTSGVLAVAGVNRRQRKSLQ